MAKRRRSANVGGLAALAALGYLLTRDKGGNLAPVEYRGTDAERLRDTSPQAMHRESERKYRSDNSGSAEGAGYTGGSGYADLGGYGDMASGGPQETFMGLDYTGPHADTGGLGRSDVAADTGLPPPNNAGAAAGAAAAAAGAAAGAAGPARRPANLDAAMLRGYDDAYANRSRPAAPPARLASPDADFPPTGRTSPALRDQLTRTTLGTPISNPPGTPHPNAGPEAWAAYRKQQAEQRAAQPATPQGSARNIVQQMREKDKAILEAVRKRQAEDEVRARVAREREAAREAERKREQAEMIKRGRQTDPYYGRTIEERRRAMGLKKGGAVKAKPKKMASGGMSSASKRGDGIATKGKTKCKMY